MIMMMMMIIMRMMDGLLYILACTAFNNAGRGSDLQR
jgi:hypothetical protein